jgi:hydrogenase nickel incorporation protein HypB
MTRQVVIVERDVLAKSRASAAEFRGERSTAGTLVVNLVSSPGAGKTSLLAATARHWSGRHSLAVLVGDLATDRDAQRLAPLVEVVQMTTGGACHLELPLVERAFQQLVRPEVDFLFVENVGNLVCPAAHDLGEHMRVVLLSVTEGDDKPGKYPKMFRTSGALVISKTDLLPYVPFSLDAAASDARRIQPQLPVLPLSAQQGTGVDAWCSFLEQSRTRMLAGAP